MADRNNDLKCHICGRLFGLRSSLKVHISTHKHDGVLEEESVRGAIITADNTSLRELLDFPGKHENSKFLCPHCRKKFTLQSCLKIHMIDCKADSPSHRIDPVEKMFPSLENMNKSLLKEKESLLENRNKSLSVESERPTLENKNKCLSDDKSTSINESGGETLDSHNILNSQEYDDYESVSSWTESSSDFSFSSLESEDELQVLFPALTPHCESKETNLLQVKEPDVKSSSGLMEISIKKVHNESNDQEINKLDGISDRPIVINVHSEKYEPKNNLLGSVGPVTESAEVGENVNEMGESFLCETCGKTFTKKSELQCHRKYHLNEIKCHTCGKLFLNQFALNGHLKAKCCSEEDKTCAFCSQKFTQKKGLTEHMHRVHMGPVKKRTTIRCDVCNKDVVKHRLKLHKRIHTGERPYKCEFCDASFIQKYHLQKHKEVHTKRAFQCKYCSVSYTKEESLRKHNLKFHGGKDIEECVATQSRDELKKCSHCDLSFSTRALLWRHEKTHSPQHFSKQCSYCEKSFPSHAQRKYHERLHTGEKPVMCSFCDKRFRLPQTLRVHMRTHTGERPFSCETCGKTFNQKPHLLAHQTLHTGQKPFECSYCGKAYGTQSNLCAHKRLHHKDMETV